VYSGCSSVGGAQRYTPWAGGQSAGFRVSVDDERPFLEILETQSRRVSILVGGKKRGVGVVVVGDITQLESTTATGFSHRLW